MNLMVGLSLIAQVHFGPQEPVIFDGAPLDPGMGSAPILYDWNDDGKDDLILGTRQLYPPFYGPYGAVLYMPDNSVTSSPLFDAWAVLEADGSQITHSS